MSQVANETVAPIFVHKNICLDNLSRYATKPFEASKNNSKASGTSKLFLIDKKYKDHLLMQLQRMKQVDESEFIPCLFLKGTSSDQLLLHFHANGEDIG